MIIENTSTRSMSFRDIVNGEVRLKPVTNYKTSAWIKLRPKEFAFVLERFDINIKSSDFQKRFNEAPMIPIENFTIYDIAYLDDFNLEEYNKYSDLLKMEVEKGFLEGYSVLFPENRIGWICKLYLASLKKRNMVSE